MIRNSLYSDRDEGLHGSTDEETWQETAALWWYDSEKHVGGSCHITHETNRGTSDYWLALHSETGLRYLDWDRGLPQVTTMAGHGLGSGPQQLFHDGEKLRYRVKNAECDIDLIITDYAPLYPLVHGGNDALSETAPSHYEGGCRFQGRISFGGETHDIDAMGYRDRSWGRREEILMSHRYIVGTAGADFNFAAVAIVMPDGKLHGLGQIVTTESIRVADDVDVVTYVNNDGFSCRGAGVMFRFGEEVIHLECETLQGGMGPTRHVIGFEGVGSFKTNTGISGFCTIETSDNLRDGRKFPQKSSYYAIIDKGLQQRPEKPEMLTVKSSTSYL